MTKEFPESSLGTVPWAIEQVNLASAGKVADFLVAGAFANELGIDWEPPLVEHLDGCIVVHERLRFI